MLTYQVTLGRIVQCWVRIEPDWAKATPFVGAIAFLNISGTQYVSFMQAHS